MPYQNYSLKPLEEIRRFFQTYVNYYILWKKGDATPEGITLTTPEEYPITESSLPEPLKALISEYQSHKPMKQLNFIKYMQSVNGRPELVVEDQDGLPEENEILTVSMTLTINTSDYVKIVTQLFIAKKS